MWTSAAATTAISRAPAATVTINQRFVVREAVKSDMLSPF
jgi:hypothetical protein